MRALTSVLMVGGVALAVMRMMRSRQGLGQSMNRMAGNMMDTLMRTRMGNVMMMRMLRR